MLLHDPQIAVQSFHRVQENRRRPHAGQCGTDLFGNITTFADPGQDQFPAGSYRFQTNTGYRFKRLIQPVTQLLKPLDLHIEYMPGTI